MNELKKSTIEVYTDGSLVRKGKDVYCGYGIYFPNGEYKPISRKFTHEPITNNRAELYAILKSIILSNIINANRINKNQPPIKNVIIYSDSEYSVKTFNEWLPNWIKKKKEYMNPDIINEIVDHLANAPFTVTFVHVRAHTGKNDPHSVANSVVDELAKRGAFRKK
jgi:ribonuclease HI